MEDITELFNSGNNNNKKVNSRAKGALNERNLCTALRNWTKQEFVRVPASGGLRWINTQNICGDVICTNPNYFFPFSIETKHYKCFKFDLSDAKNALLYKCWEQCKSDAQRSKKVPIMFLRQNGMPSHTWNVFISPEDFNYTLFIYPPTQQNEKLLMYKSEEIFTVTTIKFISLVYRNL